MVVDKTNFTSNMDESLFNEIKTIVGTEYTHPTLGIRTITFSGAYPADMEADRCDLPLIIMTKGNRPRPSQFEQGGKRKYNMVYYIDIIAGGYNDNTANAFMKNTLVDSLLFGFDIKQFNLKNYETNVVEGTYMTECYDSVRVPSNQDSIYERNHAQVVIGLWTTV